MSQKIREKSTSYQMITNLIKYLLKTYTVVSENRKILVLDLSPEGDVKLNAIGPWMNDFDIRHFKAQCWFCEKPIKIYHKDEKTNFLYDLRSLKDNTFGFSIYSSIEDTPFLEDIPIYASFVFAVNKTKIKQTFSALIKFFKTSAKKHPNVKMSFSGNEQLWKQEDLSKKYLKMIGESFGDIIQYDTTMQFRNETINKYFVETNREIIVQQIYEIISEIVNAT